MNHYAFRDNFPDNVVYGPQPQGLNYFTTTRVGGHSQGPWRSWNLGAHCGDEQTKVQQNQTLLQSLLPGPIRWLDQVHGAQVVQYKHHNKEPVAVYTADAAFTRDANCVLAVLTADCLPIVISDAGSSIVAVVHAGWRGLAAGVVSQVAAALQRHSAATQWFAWLGPAIGPQHFEVGHDVYVAFTQDSPQDAQYFKPLGADKWLADLPNLARLRLQRSFAGQVQVHQSGHCTYANDELFYSYRREGITGRMATVAWLG